MVDILGLLSELHKKGKDLESNSTILTGTRAPHSQKPLIFNAQAKPLKAKILACISDPDEARDDAICSELADFLNKNLSGEKVDEFASGESVQEAKRLIIKCELEVF